MAEEFLLNKKMIQKARKKASDEARKRNIELKNRSGAAVTEKNVQKTIWRNDF